MSMSPNSPLMPNLDECNLTASGVHICPDGRQLHVRDVYPPVQELQPRVLLVVIVFVLCFIVGICGNSSVLTIIRGIVSERKSSACRSANGGNGNAVVRRRHPSSDNAILYIAALCCVDFLMSLSLPPAIMDSIIGFWMFGTSICKLHHICGSVGRIVSTFLITAMSFDRFVAVCHPYKTRFRSRRFVITMIIALWSTGILLLLPMLTYAKANEVLLHQMRQVDPITGVENITRMRVYKCSDMMPPSVFYWFTCSTFVLGYLVPLLLIIFFNSRLVRKLYRHSKVLPKSSIPLRRISVYTILIAVLYFLCWTPYWCSVLYAIYMSLFSEETGRSSDLLLFVIYCVHLLPYFGSASNWILYGLLNTQLQMRQQQSGDYQSPHKNSREMSRPRILGAAPSSATNCGDYIVDGTRRKAPSVSTMMLSQLPATGKEDHHLSSTVSMAERQPNTLDVDRKLLPTPIMMTNGTVVREAEVPSYTALCTPSSVDATSELFLEEMEGDQRL